MKHIKNKTYAGFLGQHFRVFCQDRENLNPSQITLGAAIKSPPSTASLVFLSFLSVCPFPFSSSLFFFSFPQETAFLVFLEKQLSILHTKIGVWVSFILRL